MREISLEGFIRHLAGVHVEMVGETRHALERAAVIVETEARAEIGHYQAEADPFAAWAELADSTKDDRARQGYPENEPLLRDGTLRDSIHHVVHVAGAGRGEAVIGSDSDIAVYQELGTEHIPPRSFLGGSLVRKSDQVTAVLGNAVVKALVGHDVVAGKLPIP